MIRPGRGDITTTRSDSTTASGIECVTNSTAAPVSSAIRSSSACIRSRVISSSAPNGSSMSSSFGRVASDRAIATRCCMPPESWLGRSAAKSARPTSCEQLRGAGAALGLRDPVHVQRQLDVLRDRPPLQQAGLLERDAVVLVQPGLPGGLAADQHRAGAGLLQVGDHPQQRRLPAPGRPDQRHELAGRQPQLDARQRVHRPPGPGVEGLVDAGQLDGASSGHGTPW